MSCCQCNGTCMHVGPHSYCAAHGGTYVPTFISSGTWFPTTPAPRLSDDDVERVALAVVEILNDRKALRKAARHPKRALRNSRPLEEALP